MFAATPPVPGSLSASSEPTYAPGFSVVVPGAEQTRPLMERMAQLWSFGVAIGAIWAGIAVITLSGEPNQTYLYLGLGGVLTAVAMIGIVELQRRGSSDFDEIHDYLVAVGFFFLNLGALWGVRWLAFLLSENALPGASLFNPDSLAVDPETWSPMGPRIILVMTAAILILMLLQSKYLQRFERATTSWFVTTFFPVGIMLYGLNVWVDYSGGVFSDELLIAVSVLCAASMWASIRSNRSMLFSISAVFCSFIPIMYAFSVAIQGNEAVASEALYSMFIVIIVQGYFAADEGLKQKLVERTSLVLVLAVLLAMGLASGDGAMLVLGIDSVDPYLSLPLLLWLALLGGFMPAVVKRRTPWMPIGVAFSLVLLPYPSNMVGWFVTLFMLPYMLWKPETRLWVANATFIVAAVALWVTDFGAFSVNDEGLDAAGRIFLGEWELALIPIWMLVWGDWARRRGKLSVYAVAIALFLFLLRESVLGEVGSKSAWALVLYLLAMAVYDRYQFRTSDDEPSFSERVSLTMMPAFGALVTAVLGLAGILELQRLQFDALVGFDLTLLLFAIAYLIIGRRNREHEIDAIQVGMLISSQTLSSGENEAEQAEEPLLVDSTPVARFGLILPLMLLTASLASVSSFALITQFWWTLLLAIPIGLLIEALLSEGGRNARSRATAVFVLLLFSLPFFIKLQIGLNDVGATTLVICDSGGWSCSSPLLFDILLLLGPLLVHLLLNRERDIDKADSRADEATLFGLLLLSLLDISGGLLTLVLFSIVLQRSLLHRRLKLIYAAPWALILFNGRFITDWSLVRVLDSWQGIGAGLGETHYSLLLGIPLAGLIGIPLFVYGLTVVMMAIRDRHGQGAAAEGAGDADEAGDEVAQFPFVYPAAALVIGLHLLFYSSDWVLFVLTTVVLSLGWYAGRTRVFEAAVPAYLVSFLFIFGDSDTLSGTEIWSYSAIGAGIIGLVLYNLARMGVLERYERGELPEEGTAEPGLPSRLRLSSLGVLLTAFGVIYGMATVLVAAYFTLDSVRNQRHRDMLALPLLHALTLHNVIVQAYSPGAMPWDTTNLPELFAGFSAAELGGVVLLLEGMLFTFSSWKFFDPGWSWKDDDAFYDWNDQMGVGGAMYVAVALFWIFIDDAPEAFAVLVILFSAFHIVIGFNRDENWRRIGAMGGTFVGFVTPLALGSSGTISAVIMFLAAITAFLQAVLYYNRWGDGEGTISTEDGDVLERAPGSPPKDDSAGEDIPAAVRSEADIEVVEVDSPVVAAAQRPEAIPPPSSDALFETGSGFSIRVPAAIMHNVESVLKGDYPGFKAILQWDEMGRAFVVYEPE